MSPSIRVRPKPTSAEYLTEYSAKTEYIVANWHYWIGIILQPIILQFAEYLAFSRILGFGKNLGFGRSLPSMTCNFSICTVSDDETARHFAFAEE